MADRLYIPYLMIIGIVAAVALFVILTNNVQIGQDAIGQFGTRHTNPNLILAGCSPNMVTCTNLPECTPGSSSFTRERCCKKSHDQCNEEDSSAPPSNDYLSSYCRLSLEFCPDDCFTSGNITYCSGECVNTSIDPSNCQGCGRACPVKYPNCCDGMCCNGKGCPSEMIQGINCIQPLQPLIYQCPAGESICVAMTDEGPASAIIKNGKTYFMIHCTDLKNDPNNCGGCGISCRDGHECCGGQCLPFGSLGLASCLNTQG
ncbi:hypothetical protein JW968_06485 [Candidatus Woesearchaeota archaeon]|nr:hypothetical protein [Candidatus Woesearchaeota archaeon]